MTEISPSRLRERIEASGISQAELARRVGIKQPTINRMLSGGARGSVYLPRIARELSTSPSYLTNETDDPNVGAIPRPTPELMSEQLDVVQVAKIDLSFGMGASYIDSDHVNSEMITISRSWLEIFTKANPKDIFICEARGNSNQPDMQDGDWLICSAAQKTPKMADEYWVLTYYDLGMIKRLRRFDCGWRIISGNPNVPEETATDGEMSVLGRVEAVIRRM